MAKIGSCKNNTKKRLLAVAVACDSNDMQFVESLAVASSACHGC